MQDRILPDGSFLAAGTVRPAELQGMERHQLDRQSFIRLRQPGREPAFSSLAAEAPAAESLRNVEPTPGMRQACGWLASR